MKLKICMFVYNNCQHDSRVLKEAATLAEAGHNVRIVALLDKNSLPCEQRDGFTIVRIVKNPVHLRFLSALRQVHPFDALCRFVKRHFIKLAGLLMSPAVMLMRFVRALLRLNRDRSSPDPERLSGRWTRQSIIRFFRKLQTQLINKPWIRARRSGRSVLCSIKSAWIRISKKPFFVLKRLKQPIRVFLIHCGARHLKKPAAVMKRIVKWVFRLLKKLCGAAIRKPIALFRRTARLLTGLVKRLWRRMVKQPFTVTGRRLKSAMDVFKKRCKHTARKASDATNRTLSKTFTSIAKKVLMAYHRPFCFLDYYCRSFDLISSEPADVYHAHDLNTLPVAYRLKKKTGGFLVYDSHEFYVERNRAYKPSRIRKYLLKKFEGFLIKSCDHVITVSDSIGVELKKRYAVKQLSIILNAPLRSRTLPVPDVAGCSLSAELGIPAAHHIVLYVGNISLNRGLESLIRSMVYLDDCVLVMMGNAKPEYAEQLKRVAAESGVGERIYFFGPVPQEQVIAYAASAHIGAAPILNACLSYYYCLPNKLFECMNAGLPTIGSNFPELKKVIEGYEIGKTFDPQVPQDIAASVRYILSDRQRYATMRYNALEASKIFNWDNEAKKLQAIYDDLSDRYSCKNNQPVLVSGTV